MRRAELALTAFVCIGLYIMALRTGGILGLLFAVLSTIAFYVTIATRD